MLNALHLNLLTLGFLIACNPKASEDSQKHKQGFEGYPTSQDQGDTQATSKKRVIFLLEHDHDTDEGKAERLRFIDDLSEQAEEGDVTIEVKRFASIDEVTAATHPGVPSIILYEHQGQQDSLGLSNLSVALAKSLDLPSLPKTKAQSPTIPGKAPIPNTQIPQKVDTVPHRALQTNSLEAPKSPVTAGPPTMIGERSAYREALPSSLNCNKLNLSKGLNLSACDGLPPFDPHFASLAEDIEGVLRPRYAKGINEPYIDGIEVSENSITISRPYPSTNYKTIFEKEDSGYSMTVSRLFKGDSKVYASDILFADILRVNTKWNSHIGLPHQVTPPSSITHGGVSNTPTKTVLQRNGMLPPPDGEGETFMKGTKIFNELINESSGNVRTTFRTINRINEANSLFGVNGKKYEISSIELDWYGGYDLKINITQIQ